MYENDSSKTKQDIGYFNSEIISDNEMEIDDDNAEIKNNENKLSKEPTTKIEQNSQKRKIPKIIHTAAPTLSEIESDVLTKLANLNWNNEKTKIKFDPNVINVIWNELKNSNFALKKIILLEFNQYLEKVIWNFILFFFL